MQRQVARRAAPQEIRISKLPAPLEFHCSHLQGSGSNQDCASSSLEHIGDEPVGAVDQVADLEFGGGFARGAGAAGDLGQPSGLGVDWDVEDLRRMERIDIFPERWGLLAELEQVRVSLPPAPPKPHSLAAVPTRDGGNADFAGANICLR